MLHQSYIHKRRPHTTYQVTHDTQLGGNGSNFFVKIADVFPFVAKSGLFDTHIVSLLYITDGV